MLTIADLFPVQVDLELKHPVTGEPLGVSLKVVGTASTQYREARNAMISKFSKNKDEPDIVEKMNESDAVLASLIVGWSSDEFFQGPYSKEAALKLITNPALGWLRSQVDQFTDVQANFFR